MGELSHLLGTARPVVLLCSDGINGAVGSGDTRIPVDLVPVVWCVDGFAQCCPVPPAALGTAAFAAAGTGVEGI